MNSRRSWVVYSVIRVGMFVVILLVLLLLGLAWYFAAIAAALISLALSVILLRRPREEAASSLYEARNRRNDAVKSAPIHGADEDSEDAAIDSAAYAHPDDSERDS